MKKNWTHHEVTDRMAGQIDLVITPVCKESKLWIHLNLRWPRFSLTFSFKFTYSSIIDIWTLKRNFVMGKKKPFTVINSSTKH